MSLFAVLQMREKINTNCYKFKIKDGSFITLKSRWFSFMNPWTKEVEYIVSTNTVISWVHTTSNDKILSHNVLMVWFSNLNGCVFRGGSPDGAEPGYPQLTASPQSMDSVLTAGDGRLHILTTNELVTVKACPNQTQHVTCGTSFFSSTSQPIRQYF